jgi:hypothetical protein
VRVLAIGLMLCGPALADGSAREPPSRAARSRAGCERLPAAWELDAMIDATSARLDKKTATTRVLTWKIEEEQLPEGMDDRPLRIETAIMWLELSGHGWTLAHLYRYSQDGPSAAWQIPVIKATRAVEYVGERSYDHAPTRADLDQFLGNTRWRFEARDAGFKLLDSEVCREAWRTSFEVPPGMHTQPSRNETGDLRLGVDDEENTREVLAALLEHR